MSDLRHPLPGNRPLVVGAARSGIAAARLLGRLGLEPHLADRRFGVPEGQALSRELAAGRLREAAIGEAHAESETTEKPRGREPGAGGADDEWALARERMARVDGHCSLKVESESRARSAPPM